MDTKKSTVSKSPTYYDSEFCGRVPLNQTNMVQPHGALMVLDKHSLQIVQISENAGHFLNLPSDTDLLNTSFKQFLSQAAQQNLSEQLAKSWEGKLPVALQWAGGSYLALLQQHPQYLIVEIEKSGDAGATTVDSFQDLKFALAAIEKAADLVTACDIAVHELQRVSGFDKIMVYQFDDEWNGKVIAEVKTDGMDEYIGLKFPASDIPKQARDLYQRNTYRLIPDIDGPPPVKLVPTVNPINHTFTDLTDCNLRSVAPVHVQYLRNMKVQASMSTRILKEGRLWGLIACHHRKAKYLSYQTCSVFELLSVVISAKITSLDNAEVFEYRNEKEKALSALKEKVYRHGLLLPVLSAEKAALAQLLAADGVAILHNKTIDTTGTVPTEAEISELLFWLQTTDVKSLYHTHSLVADFDEAAAYSTGASGLLVLPIRPEKGFFILAFRKEEVEEVQWSGNPNERIQFEQDKKTYHPRHSFAVWQQQVRQRARAWNPSEIETAEKLRSFIIEYLLQSS